MTIPCVYVNINLVHDKENLEHFLQCLDMHSHKTRNFSKLELSVFSVGKFSVNHLYKQFKFFYKLPVSATPTYLVHKIKSVLKSWFVSKVFYVVNEILENLIFVISYVCS